MTKAKDILARLILALVFFMIPSLSMAAAFDDSADADFANADEVTDQDLAAMRGGFLNLNGLLVDITYNSILVVNGNVQQEVNITTQDLVDAVNNNSTENLIPPAVVQNVDNDTIIALQQQLDLTLVGANQQAATQNLLNQAAYQNTLSFF